MNKSSRSGLVNAIKQNSFKSNYISSAQASPYNQTNVDYSKRFVEYKPQQTQQNESYNKFYSTINLNQIKNKIMNNRTQENTYVNGGYNHEQKQLDQNYMSEIEQELMRQQYEQNQMRSSEINQIEQTQFYNPSNIKQINNSLNIEKRNRSTNLNHQTNFNNINKINPQTNPRKTAIKTLKENKTQQIGKKKVRFYVNMNEETNQEMQDNHQPIQIQNQEDRIQNVQANNFSTNLNVNVSVKLGNPYMNIKKVITEYKSTVKDNKKNSTFLVQLINNQTITLTYWQMRFFYKDQLLDFYEQILNK